MTVDLAALTTLGFRERIPEFFGYLAERRAREAVGPSQETGVWEVFRHDEAVRVLSDPATFSNNFSEFFPAGEKRLAAAAVGNLSSSDPPRHRKLRGLVGKAFTPKMIEGLRPTVALTAESLLADVTGGSGEPSFDLIRDVAARLSAYTIADLFGIPADDRPDFWRWSDAMLGARPHGSLGIPDEEAMRRKAQVVEEAGDYLVRHIRRLRAAPGDDLTSGLTAVELDGERLTDDEIFGLIGMFLLAGHLPTATLIGNTMMCLAEHPAVLAEVRADPGGLPAVIEEVLRWRPPLTRDQRLTTTGVRLGDHDIPAKSMVVVWLASVHREERLFPGADRFVPGRANDGHLAFGRGIHFCIGSSLARIEATIMVDALLRHFDDLTVEDEDRVEFHPSIGVLGPVRLPVSARVREGAPARR